jgi:hypothetical protein
MNASKQISRGCLLRAKAAPLQASLPSILSRRKKSRHLRALGRVL